MRLQDLLIGTCIEAQHPLIVSKSEHRITKQIGILTFSGLSESMNWPRLVVSLAAVYGAARFKMAASKKVSLDQNSQSARAEPQPEAAQFCRMTGYCRISAVSAHFNLPPATPRSFILSDPTSRAISNAGTVSHPTTMVKTPKDGDRKRKAAPKTKTGCVTCKYVHIMLTYHQLVISET